MFNEFDFSIPLYTLALKSLLALFSSPEIAAKTQQASKITLLRSPFCLRTNKDHI